MRLIAGLLAAFLSFATIPSLATPAAAEEAAPVDAAAAGAIRGVISDQIAAFKRDDARAAFAFASPGIKRKFGAAGRFMEMVRIGYPPVYRPRDVAFEALEERQGRIVQRVFITGVDGVSVIAHYVMEKQEDGRWLIDGVAITRAADHSV